MVIYHVRDEQQSRWWPQFRDVVSPHRHDYYVAAEKFEQMVHLLACINNACIVVYLFCLVHASARSCTSSSPTNHPDTEPATPRHCHTHGAMQQDLSTSTETQTFTGTSSGIPALIGCSVFLIALPIRCLWHLYLWQCIKNHVLTTSIAFILRSLRVKYVGLSSRNFVIYKM
jgi:hypothetical protein